MLEREEIIMRMNCDCGLCTPRWIDPNPPPPPPPPGLRGQLLKRGTMLVRFFQFWASMTIVGSFSYFLVYFFDHQLPTHTWERVIPGLAGGGALFYFFAFFIINTMSGMWHTIYPCIGFDVTFCGLFTLIAVLTKAGNTNCYDIHSRQSGLFQDPNGVNVDDLDNLVRICCLFKTCWILAMSQVGLSVLVIATQYALRVQHKADKVKGLKPTAARPFTPRERWIEWWRLYEIRRRWERHRDRVEWYGFEAAHEPDAEYKYTV